MSHRKKRLVVAYSDHYDTAPATLRFASEPRPEWAEASVPLVAHNPREAAVVRAALAVGSDSQRVVPLKTWNNFFTAVSRLIESEKRGKR